MVSFFRFLFGYVKISISGDSPEKIINYLVLNNISIWSIQRHNESVVLCISFKDFKKITKVRRQIRPKPKIKLLQKCGLPIYLRRFFARKSVAIGLVVILLINLSMSEFIWLIDVDGIEEIQKDELLTVCSEFGIREGIYRKSIDTYDISQKIALKFDNIAWLSLNIEGSKLTINISEAEASEMDDETPSNLVASHDGVIRSVKAEQGTKNVSANQTVRKGEVIISGVEIIGDEVRYLKAKGEVVAETHRTFKTTIDKNYKYTSRTGEIIRRDVFELFNLRFPLYLNGVKSSDESFYLKQNICVFGEHLPIGVSTRYYMLSAQNSYVLSDADAVNIALSRFADELRKSKIIELLLYDIAVEETANEFTVSLNATCSEDIGEYRKIDLPSY